jgi:murein L,D-transpeptidase YafK
MKILFTLLILTISIGAYSMDADEVRVYKSKHQMDLLLQGRVVKSFRVMLGRGGKGPKRKQGDNLVPEGKYFLDYKNHESQFYKSLHVSYPNDEDLKRAADAGVEPGGDIMIHGYPNKPKPLFKFLKKMGLIKLVDWTAGCMAVDDDEMEEIFNSLEVMTPVTIFH